MDPKGFSDFIAKHGQIVGVEPVKKSATDLTTPQSYIYKFADGATVQYTPAVANPQTGEVVTPAQFIPDESVPVTAERKAAAPNQGTNTNVEIRDGQKITTETPSGSTTSSRVEPAPANAQPDERKAQQNVERKRNSEKYGIPFDDIELNEWLDAKAKEAAAKTVQERTLALNERKALEDSAHTKWSQDLAERKYADDKAKDQLDATKPQIVDDPNRPGGKLSIIRDPSQPSGVRIEPVVLPNTGSGIGAPQLPIGTHLGTIYTGVQSAAQKIADNPNMTPQEKLKALDQLEAAGKLLADETSTILTSQQNTLTNQTSQRNADITDAASRRTFSSNLVDQSFKDVSSLAEYAPAGSNIAGPAFLGRIMLGLNIAESLGGLKTFDRVQPGAAAQQVYDTPLPGSQQQAPQVQQPQQQPGNAPVINIVNGVPSVPQSVQQAIPPNPMAQSLPGGGYLPMDNSLSFDQGQLKAPGYRADEDRPAWAAEMFQ